MKSYKLLVVSLTLFATLAAGCGPQAEQIALGPGTWIDKPLPGTTIPVAPYEIVSHASSPQGIASFELSVDGQVVATNDVPEDQHGETLAYIMQVWVPDGPGVYQLAVRAMDTAGDYGPMALVMVTVGDVEDEAPPEEGAAPDVATPTEQEAAGVCTFEAVVNLFCRGGEGTRFEAVDSMTPGQLAEILGMSSDGAFWWVEGPLSGRMCTVPQGEQYGLVSGDCSGIPSFTPQPTPVDTEVPVTNTPTASPTPTRTPTVTPIPPPA